LALTVRPEELAGSLKTFAPNLVITDSQAVATVTALLPPDVRWTTFSILMAAAKGDLKPMVAALAKINQLPAGANILIAEACAHHHTGDDIAKVKIPRALEKFTQKTFNFKFVRGGDFPEDLTGIDLVIHCGGCMLPASAMQERMTRCQKQGVAMTNFGLVLTKVQAKQHPGLVLPIN
jgi:predicted GTPase